MLRILRIGRDILWRLLHRSFGATRWRRFKDNSAEENCESEV
jgi:hypothetical protein